LRRIFNFSRQIKESLSFPSLFLFFPFYLSKKEKALYTSRRERGRKAEEILILKFVIFVSSLFHQL